MIIAEHGYQTLQVTDHAKAYRVPCSGRLAVSKLINNKL